MLFINSWKKMLDEVKWCRKTMKKHFNKPFKMGLIKIVLFKIMKNDLYFIRQFKIQITSFMS